MYTAMIRKWQAIYLPADKCPTLYICGMATMELIEVRTKQDEKDFFKSER